MGSRNVVARATPAQRVKLGDVRLARFQCPVQAFDALLINSNPGLKLRKVLSDRGVFDSLIQHLIGQRGIPLLKTCQEAAEHARIGFVRAL